MKTIAIVDTAMSGFRLVREDFKSVLVWAGAYLVYGLASMLLTTALGGDLMKQLVVDAAEGGSPEVMASAYGRLAPLYAITFPLALLFMVVMQAAVYRATLKPAEGGPGHFRLSRDEFHLAIVNVVIALVMIGVYLALLIAFGAGAAAVIGIMAAVGGTGATLIGLFAIPLGTLAFIGAFLYVAIRLSLAGPQTLAEGKLNLFGSWALTKGQTRRLFGAYALAGILVVVINIIGLLVVGGVLGAGMAGMGSMNDPAQAVSAMMSVTPTTLAMMVVTTLLGVIVLAALGTPPAHAYRQLMPIEADVFD